MPPLFVFRQPAGDVDLFLASPVGQEQVILERIYDVVMKACKDLEGEKARLLVTRSAAAVTLFRHGGSLPVQVILNTYSSVEALLAGFDVDAACACHVLSTGSFVVSPRGRRALEYRVNVMQSSRNSAAYAHRLETYASRGFAIGLPGLDHFLLHPDLLSALYIRMKKKRDLLLRVLPTSDGDAPGVSSITISSGSRATEVRCRKQKVTHVVGVQRLVVLSFARHVREVESPCCMCVCRERASRDPARHSAVMRLSPEPLLCKLSRWRRRPPPDALIAAYRCGDGKLDFQLMQVVLVFWCEPSSPCTAAAKGSHRRKPKRDPPPPKPPPFQQVIAGRA